MPEPERPDEQHAHHRGRHKHRSRVEQPDFGPEDDEIFDRVWDRIAAEDAERARSAAGAEVGPRPFGQAE